MLAEGPARWRTGWWLAGRLAGGLCGLTDICRWACGLADWLASQRTGRQAGGQAGWPAGWLAEACRRAWELADRLMGAGSGSSEVVRERLSPIQMLATRSPFIESHVKIRCSKGIKSMH